jgi:hypothetical protein
VDLNLQYWKIVRHLSPFGYFKFNLVGALGIINIIVTMITKIGHSHDRHHVFDNIGGTILMVFRFIILLVFIFGCIKTFK